MAVVESIGRIVDWTKLVGAIEDDDSSLVVYDDQVWLSLVEGTGL